MTALPLPAAPGASGDEDAALIQRVQNGDEEALQQLYRRHAPLVFHLACRALDRAAAEEIVQDTFLAVWRRARDFDPARGSFRTWLLSIGHHRMLDELRSRSRRPQIAGDLLLEQWSLSANDPLPDETLWRKYQREAVSEAVAALPRPQRDALRLAFFADLTHEEVARTLKVPLGTAKTRIRSGLRQLERHLGGLVALLALAVAGSTSWFFVRREAREHQSSRALQLLAGSQTRALRLVPGGAATPGEEGRHATFRSAPGASLAVLTLTHFSAQPEGTRHTLWLRTVAGWRRFDLQGPDAQGKGLQILEAPWLAEAWPLELRITAEPGPGTEPTGLTIVVWRDEPSPQPALP